MRLTMAPLGKLWLSGLLSAVWLLLCCQNVNAQESADTREPASSAVADERAWTLGLGLGHGRRSNPFVASDAQDIHAVLDLAWYGERFFFDNGDVGFNLSTQPRHALSAVLTFDNERNYFSYLSNGSSGLDIFNLRELAETAGVATGGEVGVAGGPLVPVEDLTVAELEALIGEDLDTELPDRDFAANAGLEFLYISQWGDIQAQLLTDVSNTHQGESAWLSWSKPWFVGTTALSLSLGAEWKSANLVDYYYGVTRAEALPGRPVYRGGAGTNGVVRFSARHELSDHWQLVSVLERQYLSSAIHRSPIIHEDTVDTFFFGLYYAF